jgi:hypothetical protein
MGTRRVATLGIVAGGTGMLFGRFLLANGPGSDDFGDGVPIPQSWTSDPDFRLFAGVNLLLLGIAAWHLARFGMGKLLTIGVLAAATLWATLFDFGDGTPVWSSGHTGDELVGAWLSIASAGFVLVAVIWSSISERPPGTKTLAQYAFGGGPGGNTVAPTAQGITLAEGETPPEGWWLASDGRWYPPTAPPRSAPHVH